MSEQNEDSFFMREMKKFNGQEFKNNIEIDLSSGIRDIYVNCAFTLVAKNPAMLKIKFENKKGIEAVYIPMTSIVRLFVYEDSDNS